MSKSQPGGWIYQIMAYMVQGNLQKLGAGLPRDQQLKINYQFSNRGRSDTVSPW